MARKKIVVPLPPAESGRERDLTSVDVTDAVPEAYGAVQCNVTLRSLAQSHCLDTQIGRARVPVVPIGSLKERLRAAEVCLSPPAQKPTLSRLKRRSIGHVDRHEWELVTFPVFVIRRGHGHEESSREAALLKLIRRHLLNFSPCLGVRAWRNL